MTVGVLPAVTKCTSRISSSASTSLTSTAAIDPTGARTGTQQQQHHHHHRTQQGSFPPSSAAGQRSPEMVGGFTGHSTESSSASLSKCKQQQQREQQQTKVAKERLHSHFNVGRYLLALRSQLVRVVPGVLLVYLLLLRWFAFSYSPMRPKRLFVQVCVCV